ncbi:MAG: dihydrodipicolinate synthase family protein [Thermoproteales archaeon]|nr:dihydrodipicolinate synthase family protein [Thermoproteales archaeon]
MTKEVKGIFIAMITPFTEKGEIYEEGIRNIVEWLVSNRVHGIFPNSSTGEALKMTSDERVRVARVALEHASSNVMVTPGISGNTVDHAVDEARKIADLGVDGIVVIPPYYYRLSFKALEKFYRSILEKIDKPVLLYNIPSSSCNMLEVELVKQLAEYSNLAAIKDSSGNLSYTGNLIREIGDKVSVMQGSELLLLPTLAMGGKGGVLGIANFVPKLFVNLYNSFREKELEKATMLQKTAYDVLYRLVLGSTDSFFYNVKYALRKIGIDVGYPREPYAVTSPEDLARIDEMIEYLRNEGLL